MPEIVDSQVHTWRGVDSSSIVPPHLSGAFDEQRLLPLMDANGVGKAILVTPVWTDSDNDVQLDIARMHPDRFAVMGYLRGDDPAGRERLSAWRSEPGMLGVRATFSRRRYAAWLTDGTADWFFETAAAAGVPVMAYAPLRVADLGAFAERLPELQLIVDHMAVPLIVKGREITPYIDSIVELARLDNVAVKVSSLPHFSGLPYPHGDVVEQLLRVIDCFGPERSFWGSDITWGAERFDLGELYRESVGMMESALAGLTGGERGLVMGGAILDWLGWPA